MAIVDTSPLQYLFQLGLLDLLPELLDEIVIPPAVEAELAEGRRIGVALPDPANYAWLKVCKVSGASLLPLAWDLGKGEKEVLAMALESPDSLVALDDRLARRAATALGIPLIRTLGLLLQAKSSGIIVAIAPVIDHLDSLGFRLDQDKRSAVLRLAGE